MLSQRSKPRTENTHLIHLILTTTLTYTLYQLKTGMCICKQNGKTGRNGTGGLSISSHRTLTWSLVLACRISGLCKQKLCSAIHQLNFLFCFCWFFFFPSSIKNVRKQSVKGDEEHCSVKRMLHSCVKPWVQGPAHTEQRLMAHCTLIISVFEDRGQRIQSSAFCSASEGGEARLDYMTSCLKEKKERKGGRRTVKTCSQTLTGWTD